MLKTYNKLVRDNIPKIIKNSHEHCAIVTTRPENKEQLEKYILDKLKEEVNEFIEAKNIEELADMLEIIDKIKDFYNFDAMLLNKVKEDKKESRGAFNDNIILESVEDWEK